MNRIEKTEVMSGAGGLVKGLTPRLKVVKIIQTILKYLEEIKKKCAIHDNMRYQYFFSFLF